MRLSLSIVSTAIISLSFSASPAAARNSHRNHGLFGWAGSSHKHFASTLRNGTAMVADDSFELQKRDSTKYVFMHIIVGNTYPYTQADWTDDIQRIQAKGVDAIALNIGSDNWQRTQIASAYAAAASLGTNFKLFISFDFTAMGCDLGDIVSRANQFAGHPNQFLVNGKPMISSYEGVCSGDSWWASLKAQTNGHLMPFISGLEGSFSSWPSLDSWYCWGCAWPQGDYNKNVDDDNYYMSQLGSRYATTISGGIYTHYGYKNFYQRSDDWLIVSRWEQLMAMRSQLTFVEMVTWNDYGESDYFGPFKGAQPSGTTWANGFPHTAWFDLSQYYITAFKTGNYPAITQDVIYFWARPHPALATASGDSLGPPSGYTWTQDILWAVVFATTSGNTVTLKCGGSSQVFNNVGAGVTKLQLPLSPGGITVSMSRGGQTIINKSPSDFTFMSNPVTYNYNFYVGSASGSSSPPTSTTTTATATSTSTTSTTSTSTSTSTSTPTSITAGGETWTYQACYVDPSSPRVLSTMVSSSSSQSVSSCLASCAAQGFAYGGTEYARECWCGSSITGGSSIASPSDCSMPCTGNSGDICGGGNRLSLYATASTSISAGGKTWSYTACYVDPFSPRVLSTMVSTSSSQSVSSCLASCAAQGFDYGGTEYGRECWCGSSVTSGSSIASPSDCSMPCTGNSADICGAGNRLSLYTASTGTSFSYVGCVAEGTTGNRRSLTGASYSQSNMSPSVCQSLCGGYTYAGVEYSSECYCGNSLTNNGATGAVIDPSNCGNTCSGDSSSKCGGSWTLSLYKSS